MKRIHSSKGYTLIELLAVIVIIGILLTVAVTAVIHFIDRSKEEQRSSQEKTLTMAAKSYLQDNRGMLPKSIGETRTIPISLLRNNKYITEDIKDANNKSCMTNSYVSVYKESKTKYVYKAYLYCGDETPSDAETKVIPTIKIDFVDADGNSISNDASILEKVAEAKFIIEFTGGKKDGKKVEIDGYSYSILTKTSGESTLKEVYSSGTLSANRSTDITVNRDNNLKDYIDITGQTTVAVRATVRNVDGGVNDKVEFIGSDGNQAEVVYHDKKAPTCVSDQTRGEPSENDWININTANPERKITVVCRDGSGSGCVRSTFTKTWNGDVSTEFDTITIKDNAGNTANCKVRVNIDRTYPIINIDAFVKGSGDTSVGSSILEGTKTTENSINGSVTINSGDYSNLVSGYMNKDKYPNGVIYKVTLKDSVGLKNWKWEVNKKKIASTTDSDYQSVGSREEAKTGSCSGKECSINVTFEADGLRKGVLTVYDKAGNAATYVIYANIDRSSPTKPTIVNSSNSAADGAWTKSNISLVVGSTDSLSGMGEYYYTYSSSANTIGSNNDSQWVKLNRGTNQTSFTTDEWTSEIKKTVYIKSCDRAGNCSAKNSTSLKIDRSAPTGLRVTGYKKNNSTNVTSASGLTSINTNTWYGGWEVVIPSGASDSGAGEIYYKVTVTGASSNVIDEKKNYKNVNAEGVSIVSFKVCDKLNNCSSAVNYTAKLDRTPPQKPQLSNSTGGNGNWTNGNVTIGIGSTDSLSGIGEYYYTYDPASINVGSDDTAYWVKLSGGTNKTSFSHAWSDEMNRAVYIRACDIVNNCSSFNSTSIKIDKTPPTTPGINNPTGGNWTANSFTLTISSSDSASGLSSYQYTYSPSASSVGGDANSEWVIEAGANTSANSYNSEFSAARNQLVYWRTCDVAGNCSGKSQTYIRIDKSNPTCSITKTETEKQSGVTVKVTCSDSGSGCATSTRTYSGLKSSQTYHVTDNVGRTGSCSVSISSYQECSGCLRNTVYSEVGCSMEGNRHHWESCAQDPCKKKKVCNSGDNFSSAMGCCYYNCNCKTYYK